MTSDLRKATPGTILHGTLKTADMLDAFASELEHNVARNAWDSDEARRERTRLTKLVSDARNGPGDDDAAEIVAQLTDELCAFAPAHHYFGAHPGDGADFGYWPNEDAPNDGDDYAQRAEWKARR